MGPQRPWRGGREYQDANGRYHGFLWAKGRFTTLDVPGALGSIALGINDRDQIVGASFDDLSGQPGTVHAFLLDRGRYRGFDAPGKLIPFPLDINDRGQIAGTGVTADLTTIRPFVLRKGIDGPVTTVAVPGATATSVAGINDDGDIAGNYVNPNASPSPSAASRLLAG